MKDVCLGKKVVFKNWEPTDFQNFSTSSFLFFHPFSNESWENPKTHFLNQNQPIDIATCQSSIHCPT